jgi:N,N-dimethylformamidase
VINWFKQAGYSIDLHTDLDLHEGIEDLDSYRALIFSTHPEYHSTQIRDAVEGYLNNGGSVLYLGGNGFCDAVNIADDLSTITVYGAYGVGRALLFRQPPLLRPESALLGVAFPWSPTGGDIGNNANSRVAYRAVMSSHPFFKGTGLSDGSLFGTSGWCIIEGSGSLEAG